MISVFLFPELFEPADCLFPVRVKRKPAEGPNASAGKFVAAKEVPEDFEFLLRALTKDTELRVALFQAIREDEHIPNHMKEHFA
jgi:hypothetical protein